MELLFYESNGRQFAIRTQIFRIHPRATLRANAGATEGGVGQ